MNPTTAITTLSSSTRDLLAGDRSLSRRRMVGGLLGLVAVAAAGKALPRSVVAAGISTARATSDLNLRSGPGTGYKVLRVIPNGAQVQLNGRVQNGFQDVTYDGTAGWAHGDYLKPLGDSPGSGPLGWGHTTSSLNLRSGPSTGHQVLRVMPAKAPVQLLGQQQNGFVYVNHEGLAGWAFGDYIAVDGDPGSEPPPGTLRVLTNLNLRAEASLKGTVLLVMPEWSTVIPVGGYSNNFLQVNYKGTIGWAWMDYLG